MARVQKKAIINTTKHAEKLGMHVSFNNYINDTFIKDYATSCVIKYNNASCVIAKGLQAWNNSDFTMFCDVLNMVKAGDIKITDIEPIMKGSKTNTDKCKSIKVSQKHGNKNVLNPDNKKHDTKTCYSKDSYRDACYSLLDLINMAINEASLSCELAKSMYTTLAYKTINHKFTSHKSAFIWHDMYITPCNLFKTYKKAIMGMNKDDLQKYFNQYYDCKIIDFDIMVDDIFNDLFNHDNNERLVFLNNLNNNNKIELVKDIDN